MDLNIVDAIQTSLTQAFGNMGAFATKLVGALIILLIGYIIAKVIKWAVYKVLKVVKFDTIADKVGINGYLAKGGIKKTASGLISTLIYWIVMFTTLTLFFDALGLTVVTDLLKSVINYIPNVLVGCVLLIVGMYLAEFVSGVAVAALRSGDFENPEMIGRIAYGAVMFFVVAIVMDQLGIGSNIINTIVTVVTSGLGLALAIAFGLGGREWAADVINKNLRK